MNIKIQYMLCSFLRTSLLTSALLCVWLATSALAADVIMLTIKDHRFTPSELSVLAGERFRIEVENQDTTPAEFESSDLRVEKIIVPGGKITVMAGPLKPGTYKFFDDYHPDTANGTIIATDRKE
jgi:heme/copper-type cytochrome/quinol oxidase subunit 2